MTTSLRGAPIAAEAPYNGQKLILACATVTAWQPLSFFRTSWGRCRRDA